MCNVAEIEPSKTVNYLALEAPYKAFDAMYMTKPEPERHKKLALGASQNCPFAIDRFNFTFKFVNRLKVTVFGRIVLTD